MRLLEPDFGEVIDRQSILQLKIDAGMSKSVPTAAWEEELRLLDSYLTRKIQNWQRIATSGSTDNLNQFVAELTQVNTLLWQAEDEIRKMRKDYAEGAGFNPYQFEDLAKLALRIANLNDDRCELVYKINAIFGVNMQEKIYAA